MPTYKLMYFNGRGRAEVARMMFHLKGLDFEDYRFKEGEWPTIKGDTTQFPLGQAPVLIIDGHALPQSNAIDRYLAREFGYYGRDSMEAAHIDVLCETIGDIHHKLIDVLHEKEDAKKAEMKKDFKEKSSKVYLTFLQDAIRKAGGKYFVGKSVTLADLVVFSMLDTFLTSKMVDMGGLVEQYPDLMTFVKGIREDSSLKSYLESRPETPF